MINCNVNSVVLLKETVWRFTQTSSCDWTCINYRTAILKACCVCTMWNIFGPLASLNTGTDRMFNKRADPVLPIPQKGKNKNWFVCGCSPLQCQRWEHAVFENSSSPAIWVCQRSSRWMRMVMEALVVHTTKMMSIPVMWSFPSTWCQ